MKNRNRHFISGYVKRFVALILGIVTDIVFEKACPEVFVKAILFGNITLLYLFCFDAYKAKNPLTVLKLLFIMAYPFLDVSFSLEWFFLVLYEGIEKSSNEEENQNDK